MKAYVVARFYEKMTDEDLKKIDGIIYGPIHHYQEHELTEDEANELIDEFITLHPNESHWYLSVEMEKE